MLRRLAEELQGQEDQERHDAEFRAEQEQRDKQEAEERQQLASIEYSLRRIAQTLQELRMDVASGALRPHK
jgi:hypothetical protein